MYRIFGIMVMTAFMLASCGGGKPNYNVKLKSEADTVSYYLGYNQGLQMAFSSDFDNLSTDAYARGMQEAMNISKGIEIDSAEMIFMKNQEYLRKVIPKLQAEKNQKKGEDFLNENRKKPGVTLTADGLQYKIITDGSGVKPTITDTVKVIYHGTLIDGKVFDSSKQRGDTVSFPVSGVVKGFSEALMLMSEGSKWEVYIPGNLGYGENPPPYSQIKPNSVLIFEIELVKVVK